MKILHTADWHFGANLNGFSRLEEQGFFVDELCEICSDENIDLVIVAGDVFDTKNPSAEAERLFFSAVKRLSDNKRPVLVIAGNHDNPDKLNAARPWAYVNGAVISGLPSDIAENGDFGFYSVENSSSSYYELSVNGEKACVIALPYANEARLSKLFETDGDRGLLQKNYTKEIERIMQEASARFRSDTVNLVIGHMFVLGSYASDKETGTVVGGSYAVSASVLPENADYIALGHLHKNQKAAGCKNAYYSGSPLQYSLSEITTPKCVIIADIDKKSGKNEIEKRYVKCVRPLVLWEAESVEEAIEKCQSLPCANYVYIKINGGGSIKPSEWRAMKQAQKYIVDIELSADEAASNLVFLELQKSGVEYFGDYYRQRKGKEPSEGLVKLFSEIFASEEEQE